MKNAVDFTKHERPFLELKMDTLDTFPITNVDLGKEVLVGGSLKSTLFTTPMRFTPVVPSISLESIEIRTSSLVCTYTLSASIAKLQLISALSILNTLEAKLCISGLWTDSLGNEHLGALTVSQYTAAHSPEGELSDTRLVVEYAYENSIFLEK